MVDKNLFLHDLAVVAIMKNEGRYLKEWLDYHLLAGVEHFYIYDNESSDNQAEVAKPYVESGLVDYIPAPGKFMQMVTYNDAIKRFKFQCRYMAFIDADEFIYPKVDPQGGIAELVDDILSRNQNAAGLAIHFHYFGSNGHKKADYSRDVLERFTQRAPNDWFVSPNEKGNFIYHGNCFIKNIVNPRKILFFGEPHAMHYFEPFCSVDENANPAIGYIPFPIFAEKIVVNHYYIKSEEEFREKVMRGSAATAIMNKKLEWFDMYDRNEEFDDGILRYRAERAINFRPPDKSRADERLFDALAINLSPTLMPNTPPQFYAGRMETFLTCRAVASYLKTKLADNAAAKCFEEASLKAVLKTIASGISFADMRLLVKEMPVLVTLPYPAAKEIRKVVLQFIPQMADVFHLNNMWKDFAEFDYLNDFLRAEEQLSRSSSRRAK